MLDFSFAELVLCFVIALIVLGPEKLPGIARTLGRWTGQARVYLRNFTTELERETQVRDLQRELTHGVQELRDSVESSPGQRGRSTAPGDAPGSRTDDEPRQPQ